MKAYYQGKSIPDAVRQELDKRVQQTALLKSLRGQLTLADIADDPLSRRFAVSQVDASRMGMVNFATPNPRQKFPNLQGLFLDPTNIQTFPGRGSTPTSVTGTISFSSTTTSITWTWTGLQILRSDGSTTNIPNGNITFSSLVANTPYWFYPYWSESAQTVNWSGGANTAISNTAAQTMNLQYNVPLSAGSIKVTTPSSGTGGGSGGGGNNGCLHPSQKILTRTGMQDAADLIEGDVLLTQDGWQPITQLEQEDCREWRELLLEDGNVLWVTPSQPFYLDHTQPVKASEVDIGTLLVAQYGKLKVKAVRNFEEETLKVMLMLAAPHLFYPYEGGPLLHNSLAKP